MKHFILFTLLCLIWGSSFIMMKVAAPVFGPYSVSAYRLLFGALTILPYFLLSKRPSHFKKKHIAPILFICVIGNVVPFTVQPIVIHDTGYSGFIGSLVIIDLSLSTTGMPFCLSPAAQWLRGLHGKK